MNPSEKKLYVIDADGVSFFDNPLEPITPVDVVTLLNPDPVVSHVGLNVGDIITAGQIPFEEKALWENIGDKTGVQVHLTYDMGSRLITLNNPREMVASPLMCRIFFR